MIYKAISLNINLDNDVSETGGKAAAVSKE